MLRCEKWADERAHQQEYYMVVLLVAKEMNMVKIIMNFFKYSTVGMYVNIIA